MKVVVPIFPTLVSLPSQDYFQFGLHGTKDEILNAGVLRLRRLCRLVWRKNTHLHMCRKFWLYELCGFFAKNLIITVYANLPYYDGDKWYFNLLRRFLFMKAQKIIVINPPARGDFIAAGLPAGKVAYIPIGVDYAYYSTPVPETGRRIREQWRVGNAPFAFCLEIRHSKQPHVTIPACRKAGVLLVAAGARAPQELGDIGRHVWLAPDKTFFQDNPDVIFPGKISTDELRAAFQEAMMYVNSSMWDLECFCIAAYEAAAAGLPLCLPRQKVFEVFEGAALFHDDTDVDELSANVKRLADSPALRRDMGIKARDIARRFHAPEMAALWEKFYDGLPWRNEP